MGRSQAGGRKRTIMGDYVIATCFVFIYFSYGPRWSSSTDTESHFGVAISSIYYQDVVDYQSQLVEDGDILASRLLLVTLANPDTGKKQLRIANLLFIRESKYYLEK